MDSENQVATLKELNDQEVMRQIPLIVFMAILGIFGTVANFLVCYIFAKTLMPSTYTIFVTVLSIVDLFHMLCCPIEVNSLLLIYNFNNTWLCKFASALNTWTSITSVTILFCIAFDRYRKVCTPFSWQVSLRAAKYVSIFSGVIGLACSWITPIIYGIEKRELSVYNVTICQCTITKNMKETFFPLINSLVFVIYLLGGLIGIVICYCRIAVRVKQLSKKKSSAQGRIKTRGKEEMTIASNSMSEKQSDETQTPESDKVIKIDSLDSVQNNKARRLEQASPMIEEDKQHDGNNMASLNLKASRPNKNRTSFIMFMVSLAFIISYAPVISLVLVHELDKTFVKSLSDYDRSVYNFFLRFCFLNKAIDPVIYGIFDLRFRESCKSLFSCRNGLRIRLFKH